MNKTLTVFLALGAGLLGGLLTRYIAPPPAHAQDQTPVSKDVRAQSFTLVDPLNRAVGTFTFEPLTGARAFRFSGNQITPQSTGLSRIVLRDAFGREIWSAGGTGIRPASER